MWGEAKRALFFTLFLAAASEAVAEPRELVTAPGAILCLSPDNLDQANVPSIAKTQNQLRGLSCMRTHFGIPTTLLDDSAADGSWRVRLRPQGISGGVTMWGRPSSFAQADRKPGRADNSSAGAGLVFFRQHGR